jgi:hypothetical protein
MFTADGILAAFTRSLDELLASLVERNIEVCLRLWRMKEWNSARSHCVISPRLKGEKEAKINAT